jgi:hypothetical protein
MTVNPWGSPPAEERFANLEEAISQVREMLADRPLQMTTAYLVQLEAATEALGRAIKEERWAREERSEFLGE